MSYLTYTSCATCHGPGSKVLFQQLLNPLVDSNQQKQLSIAAEGSDETDLGRNKRLLAAQLSSLCEKFHQEKSKKWGMILASTKGVVEDFIWTTEDFKTFDPYQPLLDEIKSQFTFSLSKSLTISNACTSSHGALEVAQSWLRRKEVDHVCVVATDLIGDFIDKGFRTLRAISESGVARPFDDNRDGLILGDGVACCVLSEKPQENSFWLGPVRTLCEGVSATRPDISGENLAGLFRHVTSDLAPDLIIAHGTGTYYNDLTESEAITQAFSRPPKVTCSKWSIGHSLGASGLIDLNLAVEILWEQKAPGIKTLNKSSLAISDFLLRDNQSFPIRSILISSLGFGGVSSALQISAKGPDL